MINSTIIKNLEAFGDRYCSRYLALGHRDIAVNWWTAFDFFFNHVFMRGRRDQLSEEYYRFTIDTLREHFSFSDKPDEEDFIKLVRHREDFINGFNDIMTYKKSLGMSLWINSLRLDSFKERVAVTYPLIKRLIAKTSVRGQRSLNNDKDLLMVLSALAFLTRPGMPANVHNYFVGELNAGNAKRIVNTLKEIYAVGDKLSAFILRDVILLNPDLRVEDQDLAFPVDTWVLKIAKKMGCKNEDHQEIGNHFIDRLEDRSVAKVAAGLWYLGFNSLDILLVNLDKVDMASWE